MCIIVANGQGNRPLSGLQHSPWSVRFSRHRVLSSRRLIWILPALVRHRHPCWRGHSRWRGHPRGCGHALRPDTLAIGFHLPKVAASVLSMGGIEIGRRHRSETREQNKARRNLFAVLCVEVGIRSRIPSHRFKERLGLVNDGCGHFFPPRWQSIELLTELSFLRRNPL